jgi:hypothetical protein
MAELFSLMRVAALYRIEIVKIPPDYSLSLRANLSRSNTPWRLLTPPQTPRRFANCEISMKAIIERKISSI